MSEFQFAAARITAAQICRAMGIERSSATVLDALTAVMLDFLQLLGETAARAAEGRLDTEVDVSDIVLAAAECGALKTSTKNIFEDHDVAEFIDWIRGPVQRRMADLARPRAVLGDQSELEASDWFQAAAKRQALLGHAWQPTKEPDPVIHGEEDLNAMETS